MSDKTDAGRGEKKMMKKGRNMRRKGGEMSMEHKERESG